MVRIGGKGMTRERDCIQENASKYVIRNCPCFEKTFEWCHKVDDYGVCESTTDCLIKRVIDKCKGAVSNYSNLEILRTACETSEAYGKAVIAEQILQLLDIEEINK